MLFSYLDFVDVLGLAGEERDQRLIPEEGKEANDQRKKQ